LIVIQIEDFQLKMSLLYYTERWIVSFLLHYTDLKKIIITAFKHSPYLSSETDIPTPNWQHWLSQCHSILILKQKRALKREQKWHNSSLN